MSSDEEGGPGSGEEGEEEGIMVNGRLLPAILQPFRQGSEDVWETARRVEMYEEGEQCFGVVVDAKAIARAGVLLVEQKAILARMVWEAVNRAEEEQALKDLQRAINPGGANVDITDDYGRTPLHHAASHNYVEVITLVLEKEVDVDAVDDANQTALYIACSHGHEEAARFLIEEYEAELNEKTAFGWTALHAAAANGHAACVKLLLQQGDTEVDCTDEEGHTPLHDAVDRADNEVAALLLRHKADANAEATHKLMPLHIACRSGELELAELLIKYRAVVSAVDRFGRTPLHIAAEQGHADLCAMLVEQKAPLTAQDSVGRSIFHLLSLGAEEKNGEAILEALMVVAEEKDLDFSKLLKAPMRDGKTPVDICEATGQSGMAAAMREHVAEKGADKEEQRRGSLSAAQEALFAGAADVVPDDVVPDDVVAAGVE